MKADRMTWNLTRSIQLVKSIHRALESNIFLQANTRALLALSGGQDSMVLLALLLQLKHQRRCRLHLCWCHHLWRRDAFYAMHHLMRLSFTLEEPISFLLDPTTDPPLARAQRPGRRPEHARGVECGGPGAGGDGVDDGVTFYAGLLCSPGGGGRRASTEETARSWRYQSCQRLATFHRYRMIQVGHTAGDRVETSLFNLLRGSGMRGVAAIQWNRVLRRLYPKHFYFSNFYGITFEKFE
jgi:tRNA(Ile)-lysidine synthase